MKSKLLLIVSLFIVFNSIGQNLQNGNWCFGINARVNFNPPPPSVSTSAIGWGNPGSSTTGSSVSDDNGQLLFYTDGLTVWNKNNNIMLNGQGLYGYNDFSQLANSSLIVPKPNHPNIYYIFSLSATERYLGSQNPVGRGGLHYSVVDMTLDGNNGGIVPGLKNIPLKDHNGVPVDYDFTPGSGSPNQLTIGSKMTSALHHDQGKIWVTIFAHFDNSCISDIVRYSYSFLITDCGINNLDDGVSPAPYVAVPLSNSNYLFSNCQRIGLMKISPDGQKLADAELSLNLYDFNNQTGAVSFNSTIYTPPPAFDRMAGLGVEFSPNSQLIYFSENPSDVIQYKPGTSNRPSKFTGALYQYDMNEKLTTEIKVSSNAANGQSATFSVTYPWGLQRGADDKIYLCAFGDLQTLWGWLGVIQNPNVSGTGCNFSPYGIQLAPGTHHNGSVPQWVYKTTNPSPICGEVWPKVYEWGDKVPSNLVKGFSGNIYCTLYSANLQNNRNHIGAISSTLNSSFIIHYNNGITNWVKPDFNYWDNLFALQNGDIRVISQSSYPNYVHFNGTNGNPATPPSFLPSNEILLDETNASEYITEDEWVPLPIYYTYIHSATGTNRIDCRPDFHFFNSAIGRLYVSTVRESNHYRQFEVYDLINGNLILRSSVIQGPYTPIHVDNQDRVYVIDDNGQLYQYNYFTNGIISISINGLNNNNLVSISCSNPYTDDRHMVYNMSDEKIYAIDFTTLQAKNISTTNIDMRGQNGYISSYILDGDNVYISGQINTQASIAIGNQIIFPVSNRTIFNSNFITKFSLQNDFSFRPIQNEAKNVESESASFQVNLLPNPTTDLLKIIINEKEKQSNSVYQLTIFNQIGKPTLQKNNYLSGYNINISSFKTGIYYLEIINEKGEKVGKSFLKL